MATKVEVEYFEERDILSIQILPRRSARMGETSHHFSSAMIGTILTRWSGSRLWTFRCLSHAYGNQELCPP